MAPIANSLRRSPTWINFFSVCQARWQQEWNLAGVGGNKLYGVKPLLSVKETYPTRRGDVVLTRMRIGHTHLTHGYLMSKDHPPMCDLCNVQLSISHIFSVCHKYITRLPLLDLQALFNIRNADNMLTFLKNEGLISKIWVIKKCPTQ